MPRTTSHHHQDFSSDHELSPIQNLRDTSMPAPGSRRGLRIYALHCLSVGLFFGGGFVITLLWPLIRMVCGVGRCAKHGPEVLQALFRVFRTLVHKLGLFRVDWPDAAALSQVRGQIIIANHPGLLDAVFLIAEIPRAVCVMRASLIRNPAFWGAAQLAGYIRNDQGAEMIRECERKLKQGENLLIFPEGTRTRHANGPINRFKAGFALAAVRSGAKVQSVLINQSQPYLTQGMSVLARESAPVYLDIRLGRSFVLEPGESARAFAGRVEAYYQQMLNSAGFSGKEAQ